MSDDRSDRSPSVEDVVPGDVLSDGRIVGAKPGLLSRRSVLLGGSGALAAGGFAVGRSTAPGGPARPETRSSSKRARMPEPADDLGTWGRVRDEFEAPRGQSHLDGFILAVPPAPVRTAIAEYRRRLDVDGISYVESDGLSNELSARQAAARYLGTHPDLVALTDSTTMGLGVVYGGAVLRPGDEMLTTAHDFYATHEAMRFAAMRTGARVRAVRLYDDPARADPDLMVERLVSAVGPRTRLVGITWVHSSSGVRLPVADIARELRRVNSSRAESERAILVVDGVHGFGCRPESVSRLGCDVFVSGAHKWLYGPRGTGLVWARRRVWKRFAPVVPSFDPAAYEAWRQGRPFSLGALPWASSATPGGFHSFENRWALAEAFDFHSRLGRARVASRIASLTQMLRDGISTLPRVRMVSPADSRAASGLVCFDVRGAQPGDVVERLQLSGVRVSVTPYPRLHVRAGCPLWVEESDVKRAVKAIARL